MRQKFFRELEELERLMLRPELRHAAGASPGEEIFAEFMKRHNAAKAEQESGAEAAARVAGIGTRELLRLLTGRSREIRD